MRRERARLVGGWVGLCVVLAGAFGRAACPAEPFPWWESDPFLFAPPIVGLTPTWALVLNAVIVLGAAVVLACVRGGIGRAGAVLLSLGMGVVCWHALFDMETVSAGSDLAAGMAALVAVWAGSSLPGARRVVLGVALGFGVLLGAVGAQQMYVEHPRTLEAFERTRGAFFEARGWDPGGPEAAMYEERLSHAEPTGWFGLTNVLATFAGASAVGLMALALGGGVSRLARLVFLAGAVAAAWTLMTTVSKGAIGAAALGALVVGVVWSWKPVWVGRAVLAAAVCVVLAVALRGVVGDRIGELSLLFRSQYMRGTLSVWAEHPLVGVGPGQFQDAYTRLKPSHAPEEVTSPHSVVFDWVGLLGVGGMAWAGVLAAGFGRRADEADELAEAPGTRVLGRMSLGVVGAAVVLSALVGRAAVAPEAATAFLFGAAGWALVAGLVCGLKGPLRGAALGAGCVALLHGQLDLSPVWTVSAPAWGVLVGLGVGAVGVGPAGGAGGWGRWVGVGALGVTVAVLGAAVPRVAAWEGGLDRAAAWPRMIAAARMDLEVAEGRNERMAGAGGAGVAAVAERVGGWLGRRVPPDPRRVREGLEAVAMGTQETAAEALRDALAARPTHTGTRSALGRVLVTMAMRDLGREDGAAMARGEAAWREAVALGEEGVVVRPGDPGAWSWLGAVLEQGATLEPGRAGVWLGRAAEAWEEGDRLTPHAPGSAARIAEVLDRAGRAGEAAEWAARAIARDDGLETYPRRRLSQGRRERMESIAGGAGGVGGGGGGAEGPGGGSGVGGP